MSQPSKINEFDLIKTYFAKLANFAPGVDLGIGDDCALIRPSHGQQLAITVDTSIADRHFPKQAASDDIAYRCLAVNLSDLAAMGATPRWFTLALTLDQADSAWLQGFSRGLFELAKIYNLSLIGGDTTKGELAVSIQAMGEVETPTALTRSGAQAGDLIFVSGFIGDAAAGLKHYFDQQQQLSCTVRDYLIQRYLRPTPRVELGLALKGLATSCLDISDGLLQDLGHICKASDLAAKLELDQLPLSTALIQAQGLEQARLLALSGGDDYELCFTVAEQDVARVEQLSVQLNLPLSCIGRMQASNNPRVDVYHQQQLITITKQGFQHFHD